MVLAQGSGDAKTTPPILLLNAKQSRGRLRSLLPMPARRMGWWVGHAAPRRFLFPLKSIGFLPYGARSIIMKPRHRYFDKFI